MNIRIAVFVAALAFILFPKRLFAQYDERESGIYAIVGEESIPLNCTISPFSSGNTKENNFLPITEQTINKHYKGETSGIQTSDTFVLVIDHNKKIFISPFFETLNPCYLKVIPLMVNHEKHCREYEATITTSFNLFVSLEENENTVDFEWERISENSFKISLFDVNPGEYAFIFRNSEGLYYDYNIIYDFTISE